MKIKVTLLILIISISINFGLGYLYLDKTGYLSTNMQSDEDNVDNLKQNLSKLILLPEEDPTVFVVDDVNSLKSKQPNFYNNSVSGDVVFVYSEMAIVFRPNTNQIIAIQTFL